MILVTKNHDFHYETANICRLFVPLEKITIVKETPKTVFELLAITEMKRTEKGAIVSATLLLDDYEESLEDTVLNTELPFMDACELRLATLLYLLLCRLFHTTQSWGVVTGIRPVKLLRQKVESLGMEQAETYFKETLLVSDNKWNIAKRTLESENKILATSKPESCSLYISIPFCPTRCDYCSFVSHTTDRSAYLIPEYVELLKKEIAKTAEIIKELGLQLETIYIGGGTPTSLSADQMADLLHTIANSMDLSPVREFTVEAGRPDTVTKEKLEAIYKAGISRISINPQTLHNHVLEAIGRKHTVEQFYDAYNLARQIGFSFINTDLIAGLSGDTVEGFEETLKGILSLHPENVTVHTLAMKRSSNFVVHHRTDIGKKEDTPQMVDLSNTYLTENGYHPYYLYRQGKTVGNQENIGWSTPGNEGLYNVFIMDETHTILGCGAGAVTKLKEPNGTLIERIFNFKFPYEYNARFSEMLDRKAGILDFYKNHPIP
ncbi:MAG: coproporphyrinogen dehydrogenase HemZ [Clostridia bacterium]|nr:coproporphyrinogen dehydrogenase HemZ [Clostridia bacterium]